jgi:hypothetical protein
VESGRPSDAQTVIDHFVRLAQEDALNIEQAAPIFSFFGRADFTFASLERYCFNRGSFGKPARIGPYTRRYTDTLFTAPMTAARADPRFALLVRELGLTSYWRASRTVPDYLRAV